MALNLRFFFFNLQSALQYPSRRGYFQTECDAALSNAAAKYVFKKLELDAYSTWFCKGNAVLKYSSLLKESSLSGESPSAY